MKTHHHRGTTRKHAGTRKHHHHSAKHHPHAHPHKGPAGPSHSTGSANHVVRKLPGPAKPRKLALGSEVACCAAEALAASLRLTGVRVGDDDTLRLYQRVASGPDDGATIAATLAAAAEFGLAGWAPVCLPEQRDGPRDAGDVERHDDYRYPVGAGHALILGADLPGSHAVCVGPDGAWWSWGEPHDPAEWPDAVIEEAWLVGWADAA